VLERYGERLSSITLSLDGANAATHDALRNKTGAFEGVLDAARQYISLGYCVNFLMTLNRLERLDPVEMEVAAPVFPTLDLLHSTKAHPCHGLGLSFLPHSGEAKLAAQAYER